jgi:hypothetical protein
VRERGKVREREREGKCVCVSVSLSVRERQTSSQVIQLCLTWHLAVSYCAVDQFIVAEQRVNPRPTDPFQLS